MVLLAEGSNVGHRNYVVGILREKFGKLPHKSTLLGRMVYTCLIAMGYSTVQYQEQGKDRYGSQCVDSLGFADLACPGDRR